MTDMGVEEAVAWLETHYHDFKWLPHTSKALRIVLDELKALQECSSCSCKPGEWAQK